MAKYAGLSWKVQQSGNYQTQNTPLTKQGNRYLRYYLVEAANSVKNYISEYRAFYQSKYKEVPKHQHKRALVLTARKFTRLVDTLLRNHQLYTPPTKERGRSINNNLLLTQILETTRKKFDFGRV